VRPDSMVNDQHIEELAGLLEARLGGIVDEEARVMFRNLIPLLAEGQRVSPERIAAALKRLPEEITRTLRRLPNVELDEHGNVIGAGLTLRPTPHRFILRGLTMFTWCALDALIFPALLGQTVQVESQCKSTGIPVRLNITPSGVAHVEPPDAVVSLVIPDAGAKDVRCSFCNYVNFFSSREAASQWLAEHPSATTLPVREAYQLGQKLVDVFV
jgi:alkylmercury lyase